MHPGLSALASRMLDVDSMPWEPTRFPGIEIKTLLKDTETGLLTTLVKMAPGARLPDHEHVEIEQTWILEGSLADQEGEVTAGNYVWRPAGSRHEAWSPNGGLFLAFFGKPNRFHDTEGGRRHLRPDVRGLSASVPRPRAIGHSEVQATARCARARRRPIACPCTAHPDTASPHFSPGCGALRNAGWRILDDA